MHSDMSNHIPGTSWSNPIWYQHPTSGKWRIYLSYNSPYEWSFVHDNYDGAPIEPFGPPADDRCGYGINVQDCQRQIDNWHGENGE